MKFLFLSTILIISVQICIAQDQRSYLKEGNDFFKTGKLEQAIEAYDKISDPSFKSTALLNKGTALFKLKKYDDAIKAYQKVSSSSVANTSQRSGAYYNVGVVYSNQNKIEESIAAYKSALRINPNDNDARENLQKALSQLPKNKSGGAADQKPQQSKPDPYKSEAEQQLKRLEQKEKSTQDKISGKKKNYSGTNGKDW